MPKVTIDSARGLVQTAGSGVEVNVPLTLNNALSMGGALTTSVDTRSGAGAISLTSVTTLIVTGAGAAAVTLAAGVAGQIKLLTMLTDGGGDATVTPDALQGGTTLTFGDVGDTALLVHNGAKWVVVANNGVTLA